MDSINTIPNLRKIILKNIDPADMTERLKLENVGNAPSIIIPGPIIYKDRELCYILVQNIENYFHQERLSFFFPYPTYFHTKYTFHNTSLPIVADLAHVLNFFRENHYYHTPLEKKFLKKNSILRQAIKSQDMNLKTQTNSSLSTFYTEIKELESFNNFLRQLINV